MVAVVFLPGCAAQERSASDINTGDDSPAGACALETSSATLSQSLQTEDGFSVWYPADWSATQDANLYSLYSVTADVLTSADLNLISRIVISTERRTDHADALERLITIEAESDAPVSSLTVGGWTALQRCQIVSTLQSGSADETGGGNGTVKVITTAIAADALIIRLEGTVPIDATAEQIGLIAAIGQSVTLSVDITAPAPGQPSVATVEDTGVSVDEGTLLEQVLETDVDITAPAPEQPSVATVEDPSVSVAEGTLLGQVLETDKGFHLSYPDGWSARKVANVYMIFSVSAEDVDTVDLGTIAQVVVHTEQHVNHAAATDRLDQIEAESDTPSTRLNIGGWPALERTQISSAPQPGTPDTDNGDQQVMLITTAVAADNLLVRLETAAPPNAGAELVEQVLAIGRSLALRSTTPPD